MLKNGSAGLIAKKGLGKHLLLFASFVLIIPLYGQTKKGNGSTDSFSADSEELLYQYVQSKGTETIVFDSSNIKQFWIDNSVLARDKSFSIYLNTTELEHKSIPQRIQLINVNETQDCQIEVVADTADCSFSVLNKDLKKLSDSSPETDLFEYKNFSSVFHLESTPGNVFFLQFSSKSLESISLKKIILTFPKNSESSFLLSPGLLKITKNNSTLYLAQATDKDASAFEVTGKRGEIISSKKILVTDNTIQMNVTIKNTGTTISHIFLGFIVYSKEGVRLDGRNFPYNNKSNEVLNVISSSGDKLIVDSYPEWTSKCYVALDAKEDLSDIPSITLAEGKIIEVKKSDDGTAEITLDKPLKTALEKGSKVRIHGLSGAYYYTDVKDLEPGSQETFISSLKKDDACLKYFFKGNTVFPKGTHYVIPVILPYSIDTSKENTVEILNFTVSY